MRTGIAVRSALLQNEFQRNSLRYALSAKRYGSGNMNVVPALHSRAAPVAAACRVKSKLSSPRSSK